MSATVITAPAEPGVTVARDTMTILASDVPALLDAFAEWAEDAIAGGAPERWVAAQLIGAARLTARAARGQAVTL